MRSKKRRIAGVATKRKATKKVKKPKRQAKQSLREQVSESANLALMHAHFVADNSVAPDAKRARAILDNVLLYLLGDGARDRRIAEMWAAMVGTRPGDGDSFLAVQVARAIWRAGNLYTGADALAQLRRELDAIDVAIGALSDAELADAVARVQAGSVAPTLRDLLVKTRALGVGGTTDEADLLKTVSGALNRHWPTWPRDANATSDRIHATWERRRKSRKPDSE
ncbi:hypothetical protein BH09MYX1_BH09MYX1_00840 [soil metagenome]